MSIVEKIGWGTFNTITDVDFARQRLVVTHEFKPSIDRTVAFEVTEPLRVRYGPVGPQIDRVSGRYLAGGGSQIQLLAVRLQDRMNYLRVVGSREIH